MDIINCPECGAQMPSTVNKCLACGCEFTVCPECKSVHIGKVESCPLCEYQIADKKVCAKPAVSSTVPKAENSSVADTDIITKWERLSSTRKTLIRTAWISSTILLILAIIFVIVAFVAIKKWDPTNLDSLFKMKDVSDKAHNLIVSAAVFAIFCSIIDDVRGLYSQLGCAHWLRKNNIDAAPHIKQARDQVSVTETPGEFSDYELISSAAYLAAVPKDKSIAIAKTVICGVISIILTICCAICLSQNADEWIRVKVYEGNFNFKFAAVIPAVIFSVIEFFVTLICKNVFAKRKSAWLKSIGF